jgi:hypothetical protein
VSTTCETVCRALAAAATGTGAGEEGKMRMLWVMAAFVSVRGAMTPPRRNTFEKYQLVSSLHCCTQCMVITSCKLAAKKYMVSLPCLIHRVQPH